MKQFFKVIFSISVLIVVLLYSCDLLYTQIYLNSNSRNKLQFILKTKNENLDIVFIGSSRVANHINTKLFDSLSHKRALNLGVEGAGLNDNLLQLKLLVANNNRISNVYLQIDSNFEDEKPSNIGTSEAMPFLNCNNIISEHIKKYFDNFGKLKYIPFYRYAINGPKIGFREMFCSVVNKKPSTDPKVGFTPKFGNKHPLKGKTLPLTIQDKNRILDEIMSICRNHKIQLILFTSPYCTQIKNISYIENLMKRVPNLIDLSEGYNDKLFFNCGHLNNKGAKIFTIDLYNLTKDKLEN